MRQPGLGVELPGEDEVREYLVRLFHDTDGPNWRFRGNGALTFLSTNGAAR